MMKIKTRKLLFATLAGVALSTFLTACSDDGGDDKGGKAESVKEATSVFDHPHEEATDIEKHKFEHEFAQDCVNRELRNSTNKASDKKRFEKSCMCIAKFMMEDLTAVEAEKFIKEDKDTQSLRIKFDNAAYNCLQEKQPPKGPKLFGKPKSS